jgi:tetratricopeptide (TPR) repeat protein
MPDSELKDTQPTRAFHATDPNSRLPAAGKKGLRRGLVALIVVLLLAVGLFTGYGSGMGVRYATRNTVVSGQLDEQFQLGRQALKAGNYKLARQYFEGILRTNSNYPGIRTAYADLLIRIQMTSTPSLSPTPYLSPTPDLRSAVEIYNTALQLLNSADWNGAITALDALRKANPTYQTAQVDGMYYTALRQRGVEKITAGCRDTNLEGGIYDLTLAEHFIGTGNLDSASESLRTYARLYIIAASFWDQDWLQAQNFFAQVMTGYPRMTDSSCESATDRWIEATLHVAGQLLAAGDACGAEEQYATAFTVNNPLNATVFPTATEVANVCNGDTETGSETPTFAGTPSETLTQTPTGTLPGTPTTTPTETPTETLTPTCDPSSGTPCP